MERWIRYLPVPVYIERIYYCLLNKKMKIKMIKIKSTKKVFFFSLLSKCYQFGWIFCLISIMPVSSMETPDQPSRASVVLIQRDIVSCVFDELTSNSSTKNFFNFCKVNRSLYSIWVDTSFWKSKLNHIDYLKTDKTEDIKALQCAFFNERGITNLLGNISLEFVDKKDRTVSIFHEVKIHCSLSYKEVFQTLSDLHYSNKLYCKNNVLPPYSFKVQWAEWCAKGILLAHETEHRDNKIRLTHSPIIFATLEPTTNDDKRRKKWINDLAPMILEHPQAALLYASLCKILEGTLFWCSIITEDGNKNVRVYVGIINDFITMNSTQRSQRNFLLKECFKFALSSNVHGAAERYHAICENIHNKSFLGLDIQHLQEQHINSQDQKK